MAWLIGLAAIAVRFIAITHPFIDSWSWRECDVAAIARNFFENGFHFAHPQIDWAGDAPGYVGTEFPILPFAVAIIYKFAGVHDWIGRLETILFFALSLPVFYLLVRRLFGESIALWSLLFYSFAPLSIAASRAFIPDLPSLCFSLAGLYFFLCWLDHDDRWSWLLASIALSLAILVKGTNGIIGLPLLYLSWQRFGTALVRQKRLWMLAAFALVPGAIWYWHAWQIATHFYPYHFFGAGGFEIKNLAWYVHICWRIFTRSFTPIISLLAFAGVFVLPREKYGRVFHWWFAAMIAFVFFLGYGNRHPWYQLPLVPIAAVFAGSFCYEVLRRTEQLWLRSMLTALIVLVLVDLSFDYARSFSAPAALDLYDLASRVRAVTPSDARIVAADSGNPALFYYAHRKGWHFLEKNGIWQGPPSDSAEAIANLETLRDHGASYLVFPFRTRWWLDYYDEFAAHVKQTAVPIEVTSRFAIYKLNPAKQ